MFSCGRPELLIVDGGQGLEKAIAAVWDGVPVQRCTVHKHRNLLARAPERLHEEVTADYTDMIYAASPAQIESRRRFIFHFTARVASLAASRAAFLAAFVATDSLASPGTTLITI